LGKIHLPEGKKGERELKRMLKPVRDRKISSELEVTEAWVSKVDRRLAKLENADNGRDSRLNKLWKWMQEVQRRQGNATKTDNRDAS